MLRDLQRLFAKAGVLDNNPCDCCTLRRCRCADAAARPHCINAPATITLSATATSAAVNITVDTAPTVSLTSPANNAVFTAPANITLAAVASDSDGSIQKVEFFRGGTILIATVTAAPYTFNWQNVQPGPYTLTAVATDNLGVTTTSDPVAITVNQGVAQLYFIHTDHLNTPRLISDTVGQTVWTWANDDPFGNNAPNENPSGLGTFTCNLRLPGQYYDPETNLHYNMMRDYDPAIGRYVQSDPIGLRGGINTYAYVRSNPLSFFDLFGLAPFDYRDMRDMVALSNRSGFSNELIICIAWNESNFDPARASGTGPVGLMMISPTAVVDINRLAGKQGPRMDFGDVVVDPLVNIAAGSAYLQLVYSNYTKGDLERALRWYGTGATYPVSRILDCENCLKQLGTTCGPDPLKCLYKIHK